MVFGIYDKNVKKNCVVQLLLHDFIDLYELLLPCEPFTPKCFNFQEIAEISKC